MNYKLAQIAKMLTVELNGSFNITRVKSDGLAFVTVWFHMTREADHVADYHDGQAILLGNCADDDNAYDFAATARNHVNDLLRAIEMCSARIIMPEWYEPGLDGSFNTSSRIAQMIYDARNE